MGTCGAPSMELHISLHHHKDKAFDSLDRDIVWKLLWHFGYQINVFL